jgi:hypothetical protein
MGKERLAAPGYYIQFFGVWKPNPSDKEFGLVHISEDGKCKYADESGRSWNTLLWSCAPTKKMVEKSATNLMDDMTERFIFFKDLKSLKKYPKIGKYKFIINR